MRVIDAGQGSILAREEALHSLMEMGETGTECKGLLVYVPASAPLTIEKKQRDPFSACLAVERYFPEGDGDGYQSLCMKARADHIAEIRRIFANDPNPGLRGCRCRGQGHTVAECAGHAGR